MGEPTKIKIQVTDVEERPIRRAVLSSVRHGSADVTKFTPLHPHQQLKEGGHEKLTDLMEHRNRQTHPHLVESAMQLNF